MKLRLLSSFGLIGIALVAVTAATVAVFNESLTTPGNVFAMGTVDLNSTWVSGLPLNFVNMAPGRTYD